MGEVKLLSEEQKADLKRKGDLATQGPLEVEIVEEGVCNIFGIVVSEFGRDRHLIATAAYHDAFWLAEANPQAVLALLTEIETTERHRHQSHEDLHRALLQIEELEAVNASLRRDLAAARDETQAMALTIIRDEPDAGQA